MLKVVFDCILPILVNSSVFPSLCFDPSGANDGQLSESRLHFVQEFLNIFSTNQDNMGFVPYGILVQFPACYITPWRRILHHVETFNLTISSSHVIVHAVGQQVLTAEAWVQFLGCPSRNYCEQSDKFPTPTPTSGTFSLQSFLILPLLHVHSLFIHPAIHPRL